jgi:hypothetical protein
VSRPLFWLGSPQHWLWKPGVGFPLFVSHRQLAQRLPKHKAWRRALWPWALDSGGFTILKDHGQWTITPAEYVAAIYRYRAEIGGMQWCAPQDWMCEPAVIHGGRWNGQAFAGTHLSVREHQERTVANYLTLTALAPDLPFIPVLQGWELNDYLTCADLYTTAGIDLTTQPLVGLGSVCRRQSTREIEDIVTVLSRAGMRLHGFGVKTLGLHRYGPRLESADSMAWSTAARRLPPLPGCVGHKNCANCLRFATAWRTRLLTQLAARGHQQDLFDLPTHTAKHAA